MIESKYVTSQFIKSILMKDRQAKKSRDINNREYQKIGFLLLNDEIYCDFNECDIQFVMISFYPKLVMKGMRNLHLICDIIIKVAFCDHLLSIVIRL